jgi:hypothetical protein
MDELNTMNVAELMPRPYSLFHASYLKRYKAGGGAGWTKVDPSTGVIENKDSNGKVRFQVGQGKCSYRRPGVGRPPRITSARPYEQLPSSYSRSGMLVYRFIVVWPSVESLFSTTLPRLIPG